MTGGAVECATTTAAAVLYGIGAAGAAWLVLEAAGRLWRRLARSGAVPS